LLWRLWSFVCGLPLGVVAALAALRAPSPLHLATAALAGGAVLAAATSLLARGDDEPDRGRHLAAAASAGWFAPAAGVAVFFDWAPGRWPWAVVCVLVLGVALFAGRRAPGPAGGPLAWLARGVAAALLGAGAVVALAAAVAALQASPPEPSARFASMLFSVDAGVVTRPLPVCDPTPRRVDASLPAGAHPALAPDARLVFFDAPVVADGGRRQIHRLDRGSGELRCITCGEPGNNQRASVNAAGVAMVFETDRHATWLHPDDTEIYLAGIATHAARPDAGRRLTFAPGPDEHPVFGPGPQMLTWSRRADGGYEVVAAAIRSGHGGILLGAVGTLAEGGAQWIAPIAWGADGRSLVLVRGNPFAALQGTLLDPASGASLALGDALAPAASLNGDGAWLAFATTRSRHTAGVLPRALGASLAPWAHARARSEPLRDETVVALGPASQPDAAKALALGADVAAWGEPTGLALAPDASGLVLGQRRRAGAGVEERLVWIELACTQTAVAPRSSVTQNP
jgi:hypothetical protein